MKMEDIKAVAVIEAGIMGQGITQGFAQAGLSVKIVDVKSEMLFRCLSQIASQPEAVQRVRLDL